MMNFQHLFALGMKRKLPELLNPPGQAFDLGASGRYKVPGSLSLGAPSWVWPRNEIPAEDSSVAQIHAYHFLEHLSGADAISFMREVERVLMPGGVFNYCVPYYNTTLAAHNLEHISQWCEDTFKDLFHNDVYFHGGPWRLTVHFQVIVGVVQRNVALVGQIVKDCTHLNAFEFRNDWFYPEEHNGAEG